MLIFDLSANDEIISENVFKKIESSLAEEVSSFQYMNPVQCFIGSASVTCGGSCIPGPHAIATLPEGNEATAYAQLVGIAESICPGCPFTLSTVDYNRGDCLILP